MESPGPLCAKALQQGVQKGRGGRGSIFVFASGNGGSGDNCNYDGYTNSIYTISIGALGRDNRAPWYQEPCAAQMAVAYSSNSAIQIVRYYADPHPARASGALMIAEGWARAPPRPPPTSRTGARTSTGAPRRLRPSPLASLRSCSLSGNFKKMRPAAARAPPRPRVPDFRPSAVRAPVRTWGGATCSGWW